MSSAAIEIHGISEQSSRLSLKKAMEQFGEVVGCHMGARGVDHPIVRYKSQELAQTALDALKAGQARGAFGKDRAMQDPK
ncbi:unnamed protein product [Symbiodinium natans]|uniref:RRM domain-containing protein n=1 Tax=Symbiodinium natans TaxID=878477 RepID=A0A812PAJ2_9DINO|nr:unnamed protein product [Symbiodinium natans]